MCIFLFILLLTMANDDDIMNSTIKSTIYDYNMMNVYLSEHVCVCIQMFIHLMRRVYTYLYLFNSIYKFVVGRSFVHSYIVWFDDVRTKEARFFIDIIYFICVYLCLCVYCKGNKECTNRLWTHFILDTFSAVWIILFFLVSLFISLYIR